MVSGDTMSKADVYRGHAQACLAMAERMNPQDAAMLLKIAEAWLQLAEEAGEAPALHTIGSSPTGTRQ